MAMQQNAVHSINPMIQYFSSNSLYSYDIVREQSETSWNICQTDIAQKLSIGEHILLWPLEWAAIFWQVPFKKRLQDTHLNIVALPKGNYQRIPHDN